MFSSFSEELFVNAKLSNLSMIVVASDVHGGESLWSLAYKREQHIILGIALAGSLSSFPFIYFGLRLDVFLMNFRY